MTCSANSDYAVNKACNIIDYYSSYKRYSLLAKGCLNSLVAKRPLRLLLGLRAESSISSISRHSLPATCILKALATLAASLNYTISLSLLISLLALKVGLNSTMPKYAYILANNLGAKALYLLDYYNYNGIIAPLLILSVLGMLTTNYNY